MSHVMMLATWGIVISTPINKQKKNKKLKRIKNVENKKKVWKKTKKSENVEIFDMLINVNDKNKYLLCNLKK
jgi:hypothetical protein